MCGHVGIAGKLTIDDEATMKRLLVLDYFRGPDSTGFAALRKNGDVHLHKIASHPLDFFDTKGFISALSGYNSSIFLGHNRFATKGKVTGFNAHPFQFGHIVGAHNGTLDASSFMDLQEALGESFDVDSMAIFRSIQALGIEETVKMLRGAWALVWIDLEKNTLNFLRNDQRDFWYAYSEGFKRLLWASEWPMISAATNLSKLDYKLETDEEGYTYTATTPDWLYTFDIEELQEGYTSRPKPRVKELKGKEPLPVVSYSGGDIPFKDSTNSMTTLGTEPSSSKSLPVIMNLVGNDNDPFGGVLTRAYFDSIAKYGCAWCMAPVKWGDLGVTVYETSDQVLCKNCSVAPNSNRVHACSSSFDLLQAL